MSTTHTTASATASRPRPRTAAGWNEGLSGAASGRGCARGTGRNTVATVQQRHRTAGRLTPIDGGAVGTAAVTAARATTRAGGNEADFTAYVTERRASLYATAYHLTGDRHEAEDLLQTALFSTYRAWDRISDKAAVGGYLRRTMTNLHISAWRRRKLNEYPTEELPETPGDGDAMSGTELRAVLWQALAKLPETQRTMLVLRYYEGRTDPEIADILGISIGTVKSSIWRSLRRLREDQALSQGRDEDEAFGELVA
ncbi:SigE family RNA polymerase sigma factor [Streptomyces sp. SL13]|jgi:RNA polymerase sigma-70 factor (sigma-E family)|uniref:SigE family RNA polymerase sigma factor n=1 Tax=Streptantibioticus silvisoli TaxID=2705255 RepID=A0AA90H3N6_9ACTN|nr:SigE family RNA polymerase sigma factor [Streptantibioticus silvisoli]MDI5970144.1 SigE family RNA polymerase sigma factor [Streptantibioticus silvisoli]